MIVCAGTVTDIEGNIYQTIKIGNQIWTVENLRTTKYNDGSSISNVIEDNAWNSCLYTKTPGYCYYNNTTNIASIKKWGALYNWYAVSPTNPKKIAPVSWHVPNDGEWTILEKYLVAIGYNWDGTTDTTAYFNKIAKSMASKTDWLTYSNPGAIGNDLTKNNRSGFSALPGGCRGSGGTFSIIGGYGDWWSATETDASYAYGRFLNFDLDHLNRGYSIKSSGYSLRLVRDSVRLE
jgi:uncharacterized protein (TIGR02145 family)